MSCLPSSGLYRFFGLLVASEIPLSEVVGNANETGEADVVIRRGAISAPEAPPGYAITEAGTLLTAPGVGRYMVSEGREILVDGYSGVTERNLRLFLLGSAFGALLHQRGLLPLHANAIDIGGRAFAFSGRSGSGKSTLAAWFHDHGYPVLADDVCVIGYDHSGTAVAYPGIPRLRLWREAIEASGRTAKEAHRSFDGMDKFDLQTASEAPLRPLPLGGIYRLGKAAEGATSAEIRRLTAMSAVEMLVSNTYRGDYVPLAGRTGEHFADCVSLARTVPVFDADRLWGFERLDAEAQLLEQHARALP